MVVRQIREKIVVDGLDQIEADEIHVLGRTDDRSPETESEAGDFVDVLGTGDAALNEIDRLAPQGVQETVTDEARHIFLDSYGNFADRLDDFADKVEDIIRGVLTAYDLHQGHQVGRVPEMSPCQR